MGSDRADNFLRLIRRSQRGRLKIYLGYAAGVGKTYQMLLEGHRILKDGIDVAVGVVETHGRAETEALLAGLRVIPRRNSTYRGIVIEEMDIDVILTLRPNVVLVDELAHTNVPGSRNAKRYQDVEELLAAGIHVISTLNIQHLESLYETVELVTGIRVKERIPDRVVVEADQLVNVDVTTQDLRRRLKDGKVYPKDRIETALNYFFKPSNLDQLRELTLRELASQLDSRQRESSGEERSSSPDQVMVCLSSKGPNSDTLLRYASRLAGRLNRNWYAVYVQTSREQPVAIDPATQRRLSNTLALAQQLGATVFTYKGDDIVKTIVQFAKEYRVGHIIIGSPGKKVPFRRRLFGVASLVEQLIARASGMTIVVLDTQSSSSEQKPPPPEHPSIDVAESSGGNNLHEIKRVLLNAPVLIWNETLEKDAAVRLLVEKSGIEDAKLLSAAAEALDVREKQGGTFVGDDVVIPHARLADLLQPVVAVGIGKAGIWDKQEKRKIKVMVLLLSPLLPPTEHLEMLAAISGLMKNDQYRARIVSANDRSEFIDTIRKWGETQQGASSEIEH